MYYDRRLSVNTDINDAAVPGHGRCARTSRKQIVRPSAPHRASHFRRFYDPACRRAYGRTVAGNLNSCSVSTRIAYIYYVDALACGCDAFAAHPINALPRVIRPHHPRCPAGVRLLAPGIRCATTAATMRCTENLVDIGADVAVVVYMFVCQADKENGHYAA